MSQGIWFQLISFLSPIILILTLMYPILKHKKLVSKYRNSEEGLIKP